MKAFKTTAILTGIIVALLTVKTHAADKDIKMKSLENKKAKMEALGFTKEVEFKLIEQYLADYQPVATNEAKKAVVYNGNDELVYEGNYNSRQAIELVRKGTFLMEYGNAVYYRIEK